MCEPHTDEERLQTAIWLSAKNCMWDWNTFPQVCVNYRLWSLRCPCNHHPDPLCNLQKALGDKIKTNLLHSYLQKKQQNTENKNRINNMYLQSSALLWYILAPTQHTYCRHYSTLFTLYYNHIWHSHENVRMLWTISHSRKLWLRARVSQHNHD